MNLGSEMLFFLALMFLLFGPKKAPEIVRQVLQVVGSLRRSHDQIKAQLEGELRKLESDSLNPATALREWTSRQIELVRPAPSPSEEESCSALVKPSAQESQTAIADPPEQSPS